MTPWFTGLAGFVICGAWFAAASFHRRIKRNQERVCASPGLPGSRTALPPLLQDYSTRALANADTGKRCVRIEQTGAMRKVPGGAWMPFIATQHNALASPSFVWNARFRAFRVADTLVDGAGTLEARLLGFLPVAKDVGPGTTRAQLLRYLAEVVWFPQAISDNPRLSWQQLGELEVQGILQNRGQCVELRFRFDGNGDICQVEGIREREVEGMHAPTPWTGYFSDYKVLGGVRIPTSGEVQWQLDSGPFMYWRGTVNSLTTA